MDPLEQRLREEVIYLHSLWHLGPPPNPNATTSSPSTNSQFPPQPYPSSPFPRYPNPVTLQVKNPPSFKRDNGRRQNRMGRTNIASLLAPADSAGAEWPVPPPAPQAESGWGVKKSSKAIRQPTAEEAASYLAMQMQHRVSDACREFFRKTAGSSEEEDDLEDDEEEEDDGGVEEAEAYKFLLDIFVKENELRYYYERNPENGEFYCIVCGAANSATKSVKKFKNCQGLLYHALSISKTTKKRAHRAFGLVICKVFGWDVERLPVIVLKGEPLSQSLKSFSPQGDCNVAASPQDDSNVDASQMVATLSELKDTNQDTLEAAESSVDKVDAENSKLGDAEAHDDSQDKCVDAKDSIHLPNPDTEWPCQTVEDGATPEISEWPSLKPHAESISAEEKVKIDAEQKVMETCRAFFGYKYSLQGEPNVNTMDEDDDDEEDEDGDCPEFKFFVTLFTEDAKLRGYYEKNSTDGDFCCLVCAGVGKRCWKRYKGCGMLLHHANSILGLKIKAHRAYSRAVCNVFGWDMKQLPRIVSATLQDSVPLPTTNTAWPCEEVKDGSEPSEWPVLKPHVEPISAEEQHKIDAEQKVLVACRAFFGNKYFFDNEDDDDDDTMYEEDEDDSEEEEKDKDDECKEFKFFMGLFTEDSKLRDYYEKNSAEGDFCCLVCAGVRKKCWKRYKGCGVLLLHANSVLELKINAHRAYARAICRVLGWDINQLPKVVCISEPLSRSLVNSANLQDTADGVEKVAIGDASGCSVDDGEDRSRSVVQ